MASIRKRVTSDGRTKWHVQIRLLGFEPETRTFDRRSDAEAWARETERAMRSGHFHAMGEAQRRTVSELFAEFKLRYMLKSRAKDYAQIIGWWELRIGRLHLANLRPATIQKVIDDFQAAPIPAATDKPDGAAEPRYRAAGTLRRYLAVLSRVLNVAVKNLEWLQKSPMTGVKWPTDTQTKIVRTLSPKEEAELLAAAEKSENAYLGLVILIALRTGMRYSEIMTLRWEHIELFEDYGLITLTKTKNKRQRVVPVTDDAFNALVRRKHGLNPSPSPSDLLFPSTSTSTKPIEIRRAWLTALRRAKISKFRFHDLRHTAASRWAQLGYSLPEIGSVLGHVDHRSTQIYTHFEKTHAIKMVRHAASQSLTTREAEEKPPTPS